MNIIKSMKDEYISKYERMKISKKYNKDEYISKV